MNKEVRDIAERLPSRHVVLNLAHELISNRYDSLFLPLTKDTNLMLLEVDIAIGETEHLSLSHSCLVEHLDNEAVTNRLKVIGLFLVGDSCLHLRVLKEDRQRLIFFWRDNLTSNVLIASSHTQHKLVKRPQTTQVAFDTSR